MQEFYYPAIINCSTFQFTIIYYVLSRATEMYSSMLDGMTKLKAESSCENLAKTISTYITQQQVCHIKYAFLSFREKINKGEVRAGITYCSQIRKCNKVLSQEFCRSYYAPPQKVVGYYVIPFELLSVCPSVCPSVHPSVRQRLNIRVRSITLIPFEIISRNLVQI